jgi:hypothetical protein
MQKSNIKMENHKSKFKNQNHIIPKDQLKHKAHKDHKEKISLSYLKSNPQLKISDDK